MADEPTVVIVGGGLAGPEAAWQAAQRGCRVTLYEMRPERMTPAHQTGNVAELVCTNSLRGIAIDTAAGLLKEEMRRCGSLIMAAADASAVPAGGALAVDREQFSAYVRRQLEAHPLIAIRHVERTELPAVGGLAGGVPEADAAVLATGPLTSPALSAALETFLGQGHLAYFDAAAPIVLADSIDREKVFAASRYGKGGDDAYLNCPFDEEGYRRFWEALTTAEQAPLQEFEQDRMRFFEGCLPIEEMARRGPDTLLFGPLKPVGLTDPRTGRRPYAVVQLRQDNAAATHYNLVGFQTNLRWGAQREVFRLIPGLEQAEFVRYGVMHRNLFVCSPLALRPTLQTEREPRLLLAGQMTGVEGYIESASGGIVAGVNAARIARGEEPYVFPPETAIGGLCRYITEADPEHFQPMNVAFGLLPELPNRIPDKRQRRRALAERALAVLDTWASERGIGAVPAPAEGE